MLCATDTPYGNHLSSLTLIAAMLDEVGASDEIRRGVLGGTLEGILSGELPAMTDPVGPPTWELPHVDLRL